MSDDTSNASEPSGKSSRPHPELDFDGRYRVERVGGFWHLRGPAFVGSGGAGMAINGDGPELLAKYRDLADLLNAAVEAERRRNSGRGG